MWIGYTWTIKGEPLSFSSRNQQDSWWQLKGQLAWLLTLPKKVLWSGIVGAIIPFSAALVKQSGFICADHIESAIKPSSAFHLVRIWFLEVRVARLCHRSDKHEALTRLAASPHRDTTAKYRPLKYSTIFPLLAPCTICCLSICLGSSADFCFLKWPLFTLIQWQQWCPQVYWYWQKCRDGAQFVSQRLRSSEAVHLCFNEHRYGQWKALKGLLLHCLLPQTFQCMFRVRKLIPHYLKFLSLPQPSSSHDTASLRPFACINIPL